MPRIFSSAEPDPQLTWTAMIQHLFRVYPELEHFCMLGLEDAPPPTNSPLVTVLRKYGILADKHPIRLSGEMVRHALIAYKQNLLARELEPKHIKATDYSKEQRALSDWADDLAVINKERNLLEKRIRNLVLNFIKMNNISTKQRGTTRDRVLACVPSERRAKLSNLPADEAVEQLFWLELVEVIQKEWALFASVFGDRKQFELCSSIINDRADAHAKDVDQSDVALYRRSLKWLSERVSSL